MTSPRKHAAIIKAWADGAVIEYYSRTLGDWTEVYCNQPGWSDGETYRVKPEPKPDVVKYGYAWIYSNGGANVRSLASYNAKSDNLKLTFDGETGKLKSAEVI